MSISALVTSKYFANIYVLENIEISLYMRLDFLMSFFIEVWILGHQVAVFAVV